MMGIDSMFKVALITGATGGIGSAVVSALYASGYKLSLLSRTIQPQDTVNILSQRCDVTDADDICKSAVSTISKFGGIDVLVNCAGISGYGTVEDLDVSETEGIYKVNVIGTLNVCKAVLPYMKAQKSGYIINIGSLRGIQYSAGKAAYSMSKAAVIALSKTLAEEVDGYGIKVFVINPGFVDTSSYNSEQRKRITASPYKSIKISKEDMLQPNDIAKTVLELFNNHTKLSEINMGRLWQ
jgi:short-subunit dehydrogenase